MTMTTINKPDFIVLGGHKCGTSSLHFYLQQHPEIYIYPKKGIDFFNREGNRETGENCITTIAEYKKLYDQIPREMVVGEVSSVYFQSIRACQTIKKYLSHVKLIAILRNPVDRALSNFNIKHSNVNHRNYQEIFDDHKLLCRGLYSQFINLYLENFDKYTIRFYLFEELKKETLFPSFFDFIGVNSSFKPDCSSILNESQKKEISVQIKLKLIDFYKDDILKIQDMLNIDLSNWLTANTY